VKSQFPFAGLHTPMPLASTHRFDVEHDLVFGCQPVAGTQVGVLQGLVQPPEGKLQGTGVDLQAPLLVGSHTTVLHISLNPLQVVLGTIALFTHCSQALPKKVLTHCPAVQT